jgi:hypothetical protein
VIEVFARAFPKNDRFKIGILISDEVGNDAKAIAQIIAEVIGDDLELSQFSGIEDLPNRKQWTEAEAAQMAADNYRQTYLECLD